MSLSVPGFGMVLVGLLGCQAQDDVLSERWYTIDWYGQPLGVEHHVARESSVFLSRTLQLKVEGRSVEHQRTASWLVRGGGRVGDIARTENGVATSAFRGEGWVLGVEPLPAGTQLAVDPLLGPARVTEVTGDAAFQRWMVEGVEHHASFADDGLSRLVVGSLVLEQVPEPPPTPPGVDLVAAMRIVEKGFEGDPRKLQSARVVVGKRVHSVRSPLWLELPERPLVAGRGFRDSVRVITAGVARRFDGKVGGLGMGPGSDCDVASRALQQRLHSAGHEARVVGGLVLTGEPAAWVPHAWVEVRLPTPLGSADGEVAWVAADPMLGSFPADAARVSLGSVEDAVRALPALQSVRLATP